GKSSKTKGNGEDQSSSKGKIAGIVLSVAATVFALYLAIILVWVTDWTLYGFAKALVKFGIAAEFLPPKPLDHQDFLVRSVWWFEVVAIGVLFVATFVFGRLINTNRFSLHYYWRNRMMRAYLGASRDQDCRDTTKNKFTGFDNRDDLQMHDLIQKPLHIV